MTDIATQCREAKQLQIAAEEGIPEAEKRLQEFFIVRSSDESNGGDSA